MSDIDRAKAPNGYREKEAFPIMNAINSGEDIFGVPIQKVMSPDNQQLKIDSRKLLQILSPVSTLVNWLRTIYEGEPFVYKPRL